MAKVGIDVDGVIYPFVPKFAEYARHRGEQVGEVERWDFFLDWGWTHEKFDSVLFDFAATGGFADLNTQPYLHAGLGIDLIRDRGHTVHLVTARPPHTDSHFRKWLNNWNIAYDSIIYTKDKASANMDIYVDDAPVHLNNLANVGKNVVRLARPWNDPKHDDSLNDLEHCHNLLEFAEWVDFYFSPPSQEDTPIPFVWTSKPLPESSSTTSSDGGEVRVVDPDTGGEKGSKLARYDLIPPGPLDQVARHYGIGAAKYEDRNWERGYNWSLSYAALQRHANAFWQGEDIDPENGSHHMAAVVFHALALLQFADTHPEKDDRPT